MMFESPTPLTVAVLGSGTMGEGIAQVAAGAGHPVLLYDVSPKQVQQALKNIAARLENSVSKKKISANNKNALLENLTPINSTKECSSAGLVIESVIEDLEIKREVLKEMEKVCTEEAILATNTSSIDLNNLASSLTHPGRLVGMHFFNPAPVMGLVEIVRSLDSDEEALQTVFGLAKSWGKYPVHVRSSPGFIVNRIARPFYCESYSFLRDRGTDPFTLDTIMRDCGGFRMGPMELGDLIGHDVNLAVTTQVWESYHHALRFEPSLIQKALVDSGRLGQKSGQGFYKHPVKKSPQPDELDQFAPPGSISIEGPERLPKSLLQILKNSTIKITESSGQGIIRLSTGGILAECDGRSATERTTKLGSFMICYDLCLNYTTMPRIVLAPSINCPAEVMAEAAGLFQALEKQVTQVFDLPGMLMMRTVVMIINEAAMLVQEGIAKPREIDVAMRHGMNYTRGPFEWAEELGLSQVLKTLENLQLAWGERCRPCALLRLHAQSGLSF